MKTFVIICLVVAAVVVILKLAQKMSRRYVRKLVARLADNIARLAALMSRPDIYPPTRDAVVRMKENLSILTEAIASNKNEAWCTVPIMLRGVTAEYLRLNAETIRSIALTAKF